MALIQVLSERDQQEMEYAITMYQISYFIIGFVCCFILMQIERLIKKRF